MTPVEIPNWDLPKAAEVKVEHAEPLPELCSIEVVAGRGTWSTECWQRFEQYEIIAEANTAIADRNADALGHMDGAYDALIEAGKYQQQLAQIRQDMLNESRQAHKLDVWFYKTIIALGLLGAAL